MDKCARCSCEIPSGGVGWHVCFHERNIWGGDTFETRAYLCAECGEHLARESGLKEEAEEQEQGLHSDFDLVRAMTKEELRKQAVEHAELLTKVERMLSR